MTPAGRGWTTAALAACLGMVVHSGGVAASAAPAMAAAEASAAPPGPSPRFLGTRAVGLAAELLDGTPFRGLQAVYYDRRQNEVFVADADGGLIGIFDGDGVPKYTFAVQAERPFPVGVAADAEGRIYVLNAGASGVQVYSYRGEPLREIPLGEEDGTQVAAAGMGMGRDGRLYVLEGRRGRILVYGTDGGFVRAIRGSGSGGSRLQAPHDISFDAAGNLYVTDRRGTPVQVYDPAGRYLRGWGRRDVGGENFSTPSGIDVDDYGNVLVADAVRQDVKIFDAQGRFLDRFGGFGQRPGDLAYPADVAAGPGGRVYVVERVGRRLQVLDRVPLSDAPLHPPRPSRAPATREDAH